jgi:UDP-glucose 4-epimerase
MRILVTGGAGFIGSHVVDAFLKAGHEVAVVDDLSTGVRENVNAQAGFWQLDIRSDKLAQVVGDFRPEVISHHAAQMSVGLSAKDPKWDADINILGALNVLEAAVRAGVRSVLFSSTGGAMYGEQPVLPTPETIFPAPVSPYGVAKLALERYLHAYRFMHGLDSVALRYANVYGPRQNPHGEAGVVAIFCKAILDGRPLTVNGDGLQTRDYVYVGDVVRANLAALGSVQRSAFSDQPEPRASNRDPAASSSALPHSAPRIPHCIFNIGTGKEASVLDLARALEAACGRRLEVRHGPPRPGEQRRSCLDAGLAREALNWKPEMDLQTGLKQTYEWFAESARR